MTDIYFVRHGQSTANVEKICAGHTDVALTNEGRKQAKRAAQALVDGAVHIDAVVTSPLRRASETAEIIADAIGIDAKDIVFTDLAIERYRGKYEGRPSSDQHGATEEEYAKMGAESAEEMIGRAHRLREFIDTLDMQSVLVVSHNQFGCVFVATERHEPVERTVNKLPNAHVFKV